MYEWMSFFGRMYRSVGGGSHSWLSAQRFCSYLWCKSP